MSIKERVDEILYDLGFEGGINCTQDEVQFYGVYRRGGMSVGFSRGHFIISKGGETLFELNSFKRDRKALSNIDHLVIIDAIKKYCKWET